jgi:hypothetical protein
MVNTAHSWVGLKFSWKNLDELLVARQPNSDGFRMIRLTYDSDPAAAIVLFTRHVMSDQCPQIPILFTLLTATICKTNCLALRDQSKHFVYVSVVIRLSNVV